MTKLITNSRLTMDGLEMLAMMNEHNWQVPTVFFDPQYRGILDKMAYGNEGEKRGQARTALPQMTDDNIFDFIDAIEEVLIPSGHLFFWLDKFHLCENAGGWFVSTKLKVVDLIVWDKERIGMGYRTRNRAEFCLVVQKEPTRAKGVWKKHDIPNVWRAKAERGIHPHRKPINLLKALIEATTDEGGMIVDPAAGSFAVMEAALEAGREFLGCDIREIPELEIIG